MQVTHNLAAGLAFGLATYDPADPLSNDVISTKLNSFLQLGLGLAFHLNERFYIEPGVRFSHYSNGNMIEPQRGINIASWSLGLRSELGHLKPVVPKVPVGPCQHHHELNIFVAASSRQLDFGGSFRGYHETYGLNYLMANLHAGYLYELTHRFRVGAGLDLFYDGTNGQREVAETRIPAPDAVPFGDKIGLALFVSGESAIDRFSFVAGLGYMVAQKRFPSSTPAFEQRLGFKYFYHRNLYAGVNVRAYSFVAAKAVEFNLGMRVVLK